MPDDIFGKIVVEVVSHADVERLEARDDDIRLEIKRLEDKLEGLHRTIYDLMDAISHLRSKR